MNKILEEFKRIKTQRNQFVNETNKKGEVLLSQAKNKFDSVHNSILSKNFNNKNIENQYEYMDLIKENLTKAIHLKDEIFFYKIFFNDCFKDLMLFIENKIKDILTKNNEPINEEEDFEFIQNIVKLAHLTKVLVEENINIIKGNSSTQKKNLLMQLKENLNIIFNTFSPIANNENGIKNKSIIDSVSKILNNISETIILIYNDINSNTNFLNNEDPRQNISNYLLDYLFTNNNNNHIDNNVSNSKIWKFIITKNNNKEITLSQSNYKPIKIKRNEKIPKNYSIHIYISKTNNSNKTIKLMKYILNFIKNKIMTFYIITNNFKSKLEGYYCFEIFGTGKRKKKIFAKIKNIIEKINNKKIYDNICIMIKISLYDDLDILMKKKFFKLLKKEYEKVKEKYNNEDNKNEININEIMKNCKNDIHYNFNDEFIQQYLNPNNILY